MSFINPIKIMCKKHMVVEVRKMRNIVVTENCVKSVRLEMCLFSLNVSNSIKGVDV